MMTFFSESTDVVRVDGQFCPRLGPMLLQFNAERFELTGCNITLVPGIGLGVRGYFHPPLPHP